MEIKKSVTSMTVIIKDLSVGELFELEGDVYMKTDNAIDRNGWVITAVCLSDGTLYYGRDTEEVALLSGNLSVRYTFVTED